MGIAARVRAELLRQRELWPILRFINLRHFREHRRRVFLTVAGLAASVAMLTAISVINATLDRSIQNETHGLSGSASLQVIPAGATPLPASKLQAAAGVQGVQATVPVLRVVSRVSHGSVNKSMLLFAVPNNLSTLFPQGLGDVGPQLSSSSFTGGELTLTAALASSLGAHVNELVTVQTPSGARSVRIGAIVQHEPFSSMNGGVFGLMSLSAGQQLFGRVGEVSSIYIAARPGVGRTALQHALESRLGNGVSVGLPGAEAQAYESTFKSLAAVSEQARSIGLLVALFLVINTMAMALAERRHELALLSTVGAQKRQILGAFLAEAGLLGLLGGFLGVVFGVLVAHVLIQKALTSYNVLPVTQSGALAIEPTTLLFGLAGGFYVSIIGAIVPALRILKVQPIDALRMEGSYEWAKQQSQRMPVVMAALGALAIVLSALTAWKLPLGSNQIVEAAALVLAFGGAVLALPLVVPLLARVQQRALRPFLGPSGRLGADALLRAPGRTALTAGGIAIASGFVIAVGTGIGSFHSATNEAAAQWYQAPLYINLEGSTSYIVNQSLPVSEARQLEKVSGVKAVYPMRYGLVNAGGRQTLVEAMPIAEAAARGDDIMGSLGISRPALIKALGREEVVVSRLTARKFKLKPRYIVQLPTTRKRIAIRIGGLFDDLASFDSVLVEHSVYERLSGDRLADRFAVTTRPGANVAVVKRELQHYLDEHNIAATVFTNKQMEEYLVKSIQALFSIAQGIEVAALLVAALIVLSTMITVTFERGREFGVERVLGMSRRQLGRSVVMEGTAMTLVGAAVAIALGLGLGFLITLSLENQLGWQVTFRPSLSLTLGVVIVSTVIGAVAAFYPAWLAARRTIISLLRSA